MRLVLAARALVAVAAGWLLTIAVCNDVFAEPSVTGDRYFIDFRARSSQYIGHTYVVYFRIDAGGHVLEHHLAGLIPEEDVWNGIFSPIRATIRKYKDDTRRPIAVLYRRELSAVEFGHVAAAVHLLEARRHQWHLIFYNCNDFAIEVAGELGLWRPPSLLPPSVWVGTLRALNEH